MDGNKTKFTILEEAVSQMTDMTSARSQNNKKKAFRIYLFVSISTALVTLLVAVGDNIPFFEQSKEVSKFIIKLTILFLSGLSTVLIAWDGFYNHKDLWVNYSATRNEMEGLKLKMKLLSTEEQSNDNILDGILKEYQAILERGNSNWKKMRLEENEENN